MFMSSAFSVLFPRQLCCPKIRVQPFTLSLNNSRFLHVSPSRFLLRRPQLLGSPHTAYAPVQKSGLHFLLKAAGAAGVGLGATIFLRTPIYSDGMYTRVNITQDAL